MEGWVDLGYLAMHRPGVELAIFRSLVQRPNHYTTESTHLLTVSFFFLFFSPASFLPIHHAAIHHAVTHAPFIYVYEIILCLISFCFLELYSEFHHFSFYPLNWFSPSFSRSTCQQLPVYFYLPVLMSMSLQHTLLHSKNRHFIIDLFSSKFNFPVNSPFLSMRNQQSFSRATS